MKKFLTLILSLFILLASLPLSACQNDTGENDGKTEETNTSDLIIVENGASDYTIVLPQTGFDNDFESDAGLSIRVAIRTATKVNIARVGDQNAESDKEILIGQTNRAESLDAAQGLKIDEFIIRVVGNKLVICGANSVGTYYAAKYFCENFINDSGSVIIDKDLNYAGRIDFSVSSSENIAFETMADTLFSAYVSKYISSNGSIIGTEFWDSAEILEAFIDAYEQTKNSSYLKYAEDIAIRHFGFKDAKTSWCQSNPYNDDIAWACIGFMRLYNLTGKENYLTIAKNNFDEMWKRAYSSDLGGGLWWKDDQRDCKNSCIQCPASIAACLIGKAISDDSYYEKASEVMEWEFENLFNNQTGQVYDNISTNGQLNDIVFTYNLGTFVGACTLLHEKYGDDLYLQYAAKAVDYGMNKLENVGGVLNGENSGNDIIGFKGILSRWYYRYAKYTQNVEVLYWLQKNANTAYRNRNDENIVWTTWATKTQNAALDPWGASAAVALLFNCEPWWD